MQNNSKYPQKNDSPDYQLERDTRTLDCDKYFSAQKIYYGIIITLQGKFLVLTKCVYVILNVQCIIYNHISFIVCLCVCIKIYEYFLRLVEQISSRHQRKNKGSIQYLAEIPRDLGQQLCHADKSYFMFFCLKEYKNNTDPLVVVLASKKLAWPNWPVLNVTQKPIFKGGENM